MANAPTPPRRPADLRAETAHVLLPSKAAEPHASQPTPAAKAACASSRSRDPMACGSP